MFSLNLLLMRNIFQRNFLYQKIICNLHLLSVVVVTGQMFVFSSLHFTLAYYLGLMYYQLSRRFEYPADLLRPPKPYAKVYRFV